MAAGSVPDVSTDDRRAGTGAGQDTRRSAAAQTSDPATDTRSTARTRAPAADRRRWLFWLLAPAAVYLAVRMVGLAVLVVFAAANDTTVTDALTAWDGQWYLGIASGGYTDVPLGLVDANGVRDATTPYAFFPGYPYLVRWAAWLPGVGLVSAGIVISLLSGVLAAYALMRIGAAVSTVPGHRKRTGMLLVALFAAAPMAVALSMTYSEALFCALAAWALVGVLERRWLLAGLSCLGAGLVRPTATALVLTVLLAALVAIVTRRDRWWPWLGAALAPLGLVGYLAVVGVVTGQLLGWFALQQRGWESTFDGGAATARFAIEALTSSRDGPLLITIGVLAAALVLAGVGVRMRLPWPLLVYGFLVLLMDIGSNGLMNSKARLLLPAFTLLIPLAVALARRRPMTAVVSVAGVSVFSAWFGAHALTVWPYAI